MSFNVFISYSTKDLPTVEHVKRALAVPGVNVFIAEYSAEPGAPLAARIDAAIRTCNLFVLLWSRNSKESEWVPQEIGIARACSKQIVPIVMDKGLNLPGFIKDLKYAELHRGPEALMRWLRERVVAQAAAKAKAESNSRTFATVATIGALLLLAGSGNSDSSDDAW